MTVFGVRGSLELNPIINPVYFGESESLFGVLHEPLTDRPRHAGVVICPPVFRDYWQAHSTLRRVADHLAGRGYSVLRFDYFGTGDSAGDVESASLLQWSNDVQQACLAMEEMADIEDLSVLAFGLGATLAVSGVEVQIRDLVLYDPVYSGATYLAGLRSAFELSPKLAQLDQEIQGYPMNRAWIEEIGGLVLPELAPNNADRIVILEPVERSDSVGLPGWVNEGGGVTRLQFDLGLDASMRGLSQDGPLVGNLSAHILAMVDTALRANDA